VKIRSIGWTAALGVLLAAGTAAAAAGDLLQGRVHDMSRENRPLTEKWKDAARSARSGQDGDLFFTGHVFLSRHGIRRGEKWDRPRDYMVEAASGRIRLRRGTRSERGSSWSMESEGEGPAGILLLHRLSGTGSDVVDVHMINLEDGHVFEKTPVYWMGEAETSDSLDCLTSVFEGSGERLRDRLVFLIGSHSDPRAGEFLFRTALGESSFKVRKSAVFWIGNLRNQQSLPFLQDIYKEARDSGLREQVVFALHICDDERAPAEMLGIARGADSRKVRKSAIFWLGQKVSEESIGFLREVVDSDENDDLKDAAVFAISQLPRERSVPLLIDIARTNRSAAARKKAIFWLGQTGSPEALDFFEEILFKKD